ncbi:glycosyltransferase family 4 protein [Aquisalimonas sp. 2447]|uniref:glycosyltransferase family 4 protein n=1 Tax=Aquisalimonas sp. 2447 TaxID=2740807 RepID=UPI0020C26734|nr:glycosyltransferase family 4 protein [Aquisalimonas sp. 2447]
MLTLASVLQEQGIEICIATQRDSELFIQAEAQGLKTSAVELVGVLRERHGALFGGSPVFRLKALFSVLAQNLGIARKVRNHHADVVWIRSSKGIAFAGLGALLSRRPLVWDVDYELPSRGVVRWLHRLGLWAAKNVIFQYSAAPDAIFGEKLATRYRHKFHAIVPGIDLEFIEPFRTERKARKRTLDDPFVILQVGTICERKNQQLLVDAVVLLRQARPNTSIRVQFAGGVFEQGYAEALKEKVYAAGIGEEVEFLGWRSDIHELMAGADLLVMPSRDEGVPNTVQEAMAIGLPVLVSEAGGMPESVIDGETGWVLKIDKPESWAKRMEWCLENWKQLDEVGQRAAAYAWRHFGTWQWGGEYGRLIVDSARQPE